MIFLLQVLGCFDFGYRYLALGTGMACLQATLDLFRASDAGLRVRPYGHPFLADMEALQPWVVWMDAAARLVFWRGWGRRFSRESAYAFLCPRKYFYLDPYEFLGLWNILLKYGLMGSG